ncbi:MAG: hypothetical protein IPG11_08730 [Flavobacteriales bacterium]|nr:hypothetical protein [Flavobacteriales bacterium]
MKIAAEGALEWQHCLGGSGLEFASEIRQTLDGGYILIGYVDSTDGDVSQFIGVRDTWVVKLDPTGELEWERSYGGTFTDYGLSVIVLNNGEYLLFGVTASPNIPGLHARAILYASEDHVLLSGITLSSDGQISSPHGMSDAWVVRLDTTLNLMGTSLGAGRTTKVFVLLTTAAWLW